MADRSKIEWCDASWNPIRARNLATGKIGWHCEHVSEGCRNCYAETLNKRLGTGLDYKPGNRDLIDIFLDERLLLQPLHWKRPRKIFVGSMTDLFADFVSDDMLDSIFAVAALCPQHTFQLLTKRPERMRRYFEYDRVLKVIIRVDGDWPGWPLPNVWLGVSCEDQSTVDTRIPDLLATPAARRFISAEPLLGQMKLTHVCEGVHDDFKDCGGHPDPRYAPESVGWGRTDVLRGQYLGTAQTPDGVVHYDDEECGYYEPRIGWVICGGESGPHARSMHPDWARSLRDQCAAAGVPFFFKQWGEYLPCGQILPGYGKVCGATAVKPGRMKLHYVGAPKQEPKHAFAEHGVEFTSTADRQLTFRTGKRRAGRLLDGVEHNAFPEAR